MTDMLDLNLVVLLRKKNKGDKYVWNIGSHREYRY